MKKANFLISEKHERIIILYRQTRRILFADDDSRKKKLEWLTIDEAAELSGKNASDIRHDLSILRKENNQDKPPKH